MKPHHTFIFATLATLICCPPWSTVSTASLQSTGTEIDIEPTLESLFNFTYNSRLLYLLKNEVIQQESHASSQISSSCLSVLHTLLTSTTKHRWSLAMLDANPPIPASLLWDQMSSVGGFEQCLDISSTYNDIDFNGEYCLLGLRVNSTLPLKTAPGREMDNFIARLQHVNKRYPLVLGICIPSVCTATEIDLLVHNHFSKMFSMPMFDAKVEHCQTNNDYVGSKTKSFYTLANERNSVIALLIIGTTVILVLVGTAVDLYTDRFRKTKPRINFLSIITCFSAIRNSAILLGLNLNSDKNENASLESKDSLTEKPIEKRFAHLHGFRAFLILWINIAHSSSLIPASIIMPVAMLSQHPHDMIEMAKFNGAMGNLLTNGTLAVAAFFLISGFLLVSLTIAKNMQKVNFFPFMFVRFIRFAPSLLGIIVVYKASSLVGRGPFFSNSVLNSTVLKACNDNQWWKTFLFVNNWFNLSDSCIPISWFVSIDMQIHLLAFGLIILLRKRLSRAFLGYCTLMMTLSAGLPIIFLLSGAKTFATLDLFSAFEYYSVRDYVMTYSGTHIHLGFYFFGAILGYNLMLKNQFQFGNQMRHKLIWWASTAFVVLGTFTPAPTSEAAGHLGKGLAIGTLHAVWILCLGVMFYILSQPNTPDYAATVNKFLSSNIFRPISRLSFSMYLTHMMPIWFNVYSSRSPLEVNTLNMTLFSFAVLGETFTLSYFIFILFECPSVNLLKLFMDVNKISSKSGNSQTTSTCDEETSLKKESISHNGTFNGHASEPSNEYLPMNGLPSVVVQRNSTLNNNPTI